jgi:DNA repair exonuclease SbcCD ATPase subunit
LSDENTGDVQETEPITELAASGPEVDDSRIKKANSEAASYRKQLRDAQAELEQLRAAAQEAENAKLSDIERANKTAADNAARAEKLAADLARYKVIATTGLPAELHEFLPEGIADEELLLQRAQKLQSALGKPPAGPRPDSGQGARPPAAQSDSDALYESIYGPQAQR